MNLLPWNPESNNPENICSSSTSLPCADLEVSTLVVCHKNPFWSTGSNANYDRWLRDSVLLSLSIKSYVNIQVLFCSTFVSILDWIMRGWSCLSHLVPSSWAIVTLLKSLYSLSPPNAVITYSHTEQELQLFRTCWIPVIPVIWMNLVDMVDMVDIVSK